MLMETSRNVSRDGKAPPPSAEFCFINTTTRLSTNVTTKAASWPTYKPAAQLLMIQGCCCGFFAFFWAIGLTCGPWGCCSFWSHGSAGGVRPKLLWGPKPRGKTFKFICFHIFSIYLWVMDTFSDSCPSCRTCCRPLLQKEKLEVSKMDLFIWSSMLFFSHFRSSMPLPQRSGTPQGAAC